MVKAERLNAPLQRPKNFLLAGFDGCTVVVGSLELLHGFEEAPEWLHDGVLCVEAVNLVGEAMLVADSSQVLGLGEFSDALEHVLAVLYRVGRNARYSTSFLPKQNFSSLSERSV